MRLLSTLNTLLAPRKAEFSKRLAAKRYSLASERLFAGMAPKGKAAYELRKLGLHSVVRIPVNVTADSGNATTDSGDRDRARCCAL